MSLVSEINIIKNLVREYSRTIGGVEAERIQHYGDIAVSKLKEHNFELEEEERVILLETIRDYGEGLPLTRITSLLNHPLE